MSSAARVIPRFSVTWNGAVPSRHGRLHRHRLVVRPLSPRGSSGPPDARSGGCIRLEGARRRDFGGARRGAPRHAAGELRLAGGQGGGPAGPDECAAARGEGLVLHRQGPRGPGQVRQCRQDDGAAGFHHRREASRPADGSNDPSAPVRCDGQILRRCEGEGHARRRRRGADAARRGRGG